VGTYALLMTFNGAGNGCLISGLLFNNFAFAPSSTGTGITPVATQVSYILDNPGLASNGQAIYGFEFNPNLSVVGPGSEDMLLSYSIIDLGGPGITSIHLLANAVINGAASATVAEGPNRACTGVGTGCVLLPTLTVNASAPHMDLLNIGPYTEIDVLKNINVTANAGGSAVISLVRDAVDTPEPATFVLFGAGFALVTLGRRLKLRPRT
jgi:hypothetical protein